MSACVPIAQVWRTIAAEARKLASQGFRFPLAVMVADASGNNASALLYEPDALADAGEPAGALELPVNVVMLELGACRGFAMLITSPEPDEAMTKRPAHQWLH